MCACVGAGVRNFIDASIKKAAIAESNNMHEQQKIQHIPQHVVGLHPPDKSEQLALINRACGPSPLQSIGVLSPLAPVGFAHVAGASATCVCACRCGVPFIDAKTNKQHAATLFYCQQSNMF